MTNVVPIPVWKKGASAADWLEELASIARVHPKRFNKIVLIYQEDSAEINPESSMIDVYHHGCTASETMGMITLAAHFFFRNQTGG